MTAEARMRRQVRTPVLVAAATAWVFLVLTSNGVLDSTGAHGHHHDPGAAMSPSVGPWLAGWLLMLVAMMGPLLIPAIRYVIHRSLPRRRARAVLLIVTAYGLVWVFAGLVLTGLAMMLHQWASSTALGSFAVSWPPILALVVAAIWQASPVKQRCLNRHMAFAPIAAFGRAHDRDVFRLGVRHGMWCLGSCWALMWVPLLLGGSGHLVAMALVAALMWTERFDRPAPPSWRLRLPVTALRILMARWPSAGLPRRTAAAQVGRNVPA